MSGVQIYLTWLCYFYLALSLRENVLMVNGSHIKGWWIEVRRWDFALVNTLGEYHTNGLGDFLKQDVVSRTTWLHIQSCCNL